MGGNNNLLDAAVTAFGATSPQLVAEGYNTVHRVTRDGEFFALRRCRDDLSDAELCAELSWMSALAEEPWLRVPRPQPCGDAPWFVDSQAGRWVLSSWVSGEHRRRDPGVEEARILGRTMARLHRFSRGFALPSKAQRVRFEGIFLQGQDRRELLGAVDETLFRSFDEAIVNLNSDLLRQECILLHGDLHLGNVLFEDDSAIGVIDFDDSGLGHPIQDAAICLYYLRHCENYEVLETAFYDGYRELLPIELSSVQRELLWAWRTLGLMAVALDPSASPAIKDYLRRQLPRWRQEFVRLKVRLDGDGAEE